MVAPRQSLAVQWRSSDDAQRSAAETPDNQPMTYLRDYARAIAGVAETDDATEHSYRTPIQKMLEAAAAECGADVDILQKPGAVKNAGAPDFRVSDKSGGIIGYVECKPPGANLQKLTTRAQLEKYRTLSGNILLTDCWRWLLFRDGKKIGDATLSERPDKKTQDEFSDLLRTFIAADAEKIGDAKRLAAVLARRCALLRAGLENHAGDASHLHGLWTAFRAALNSELEFSDFADALAQTVVYSLLMAKLKAPAGEKLDLYNINRHIPGNFAVIRDITTFLQHLREAEYGDIGWAVDDVLATINGMDAAAVVESMAYGKNGKGFSDADDPYIHFYEDFLAAYDAGQRKKRGVYYTPPPVVKFIVRAVDDVLRRDFGMNDGLAAPRQVTVLDFAAGTGTFLLEMMRAVLTDKPLAHRHMLTHGHILENFYGFELTMAPYVIAHLKLSQFLADHGAPLEEDERINVLLTNTLEYRDEQAKLPLMPNLAEEVNRAQDVKDTPVLVVTGNPPYSGHSQNKGEWIAGLIEDYREVDGKPLGERNPKGLLDDYVKFIRFAQWKMEQVERGIVAVITNHGFLENPTFRGMRQSLLNAFDALYFLDLHGNAKKKETAPGGGKDENVFLIEQGVAVSILVKNPAVKHKGVFHADVYGVRDHKYAFCLKSNIESINWKPLSPATPFYSFVPRRTMPAKYRKSFSVKDIFSSSVVGMATSRDHFAFAFAPGDIEARINNLIDADLSTEELREKYNLRDTRDWSLDDARRQLRESHSFDEFLVPCSYRPFDARWCYYGKETMDTPRPGVMRHMLAGENVGLCVSKRQEIGGEWRHVFAADKIVQNHTATAKEATHLFPLYLYDPNLHPPRRENLAPEFRHWIDDRYGTAHSPEAILHCIYAVLHSPGYRKRYADFLRTDFPRIPFPAENAEFRRLAAVGKNLMAAHLLRGNCAGKLAQLGGAGISHAVENIRYNGKEERLYFNKDEWFENVPPAVFKFTIGGYQPLDKYLKSRKGRKLSLKETDTVAKAANAIEFTMKKMREIDP